MKTKMTFWNVGAAAMLIAGASMLPRGPVRAHEEESQAKPGPSDPIHFVVEADHQLIPMNGGPQEIVVKIDLTAIPHTSGKRVPLNIAVVLDRSGSMAGRKLEQAKQAASMLVDQLLPGDAFSLVAYESDVEVLIAAQKVGKGKGRIHRQIERLASGGSTALYAGVRAGANQLEEYLTDRRINRVMLLSDGIANVGPTSNREIASLGRRISQQGIAVTTIGLGNDYNEDLLSALAEASDANYYYVQDVEKLNDVFADELGELQSVVARKIIVKVRTPDAVEVIGFIGRSESFDKGEAHLSFNQIAGSQNRYAYLKCRVDPRDVIRTMPVVFVDLEYANEIADGSPTVTRSHAVELSTSDDLERVERLKNREIAVEAAILENGAATDRAIAMADEGRMEEAKEAIACQIDYLCKTRDAAPASQQAVLDAEIELLERNQDSFGRSGLDKESRKILQWNNYQLRNSKRRVK